MGVMEVLVVGQHVTFPVRRWEVFLLQHLLGLSAAGSVTLGLLTIKMRLGPGSVAYAVRSASGLTPPQMATGRWGEDPLRRKWRRAFGTKHLRPTKFIRLPDDKNRFELVRET
jgi:hypothetical protein